MDHGVLKHWPLFLLAAAAFSFGAFKLAMQPSAQMIHPEDPSIEMIRPREAAKGYDLSGRQVVRNIHSLPRADATPIAESKLRPNQSPQAIAEAKAKALKAEAAKKVEAAKKQALAKAQEAKRKAKLAVRVVEKQDSKMAGFTATIPAGNYSNGYAGGGYVPPVSAPADNSNQPAEEEKQVLSAAQWRALLHGQPTEKNALQFAAAFRAGEVDSASFYQISEELLGDSAADRSKIGLLILKQDFSAKTFSALVANYKDTTPEPLKTNLYAVLKSYADVTRFSIMNKVLLSADSRSVQMAAQLLKQVVDAQNIVKQDISGRDVRSPGSAPIPSAQFQSFVPTLRRLASSQDATVAQQAQTLLDSIQALKAA